MLPIQGNNSKNSPDGYRAYGILWYIGVISKEYETLEINKCRTWWDFFFLIWMSHYDKQTHTYSLKTCVYTQSRIAAALSPPTSGEGGSDNNHRTNLETPISHLCFLPPCFWSRRTCIRQQEREEFLSNSSFL